MKKVCSRCGEMFENTLEFFHEYISKDGSRRLKGVCKVCIRKADKIRYYRNPEASKEYGRRWIEKNRDHVNRYQLNRYHTVPGVREQELKKCKELNKAHPEIARFRLLRRKYKMEPKDVIALMDYQRGCCAICGGSLVYPESKQTFSVDHNHNTGEVRGLLCSRCNTGIGKFDDDTDILEKAIIYLNSYKRG